jgi:DNA-directed RNA polymerase specialized sigma24 family protein
MPANLPNLTELYRLATGETAGVNAIAAQLKRESKRRRAIVKARIAGASLREIGIDHGISHGSVRSVLLLTMRAIRKRLRVLPRYHQEGRPPGRGYGKKRVAIAR